MCPIKLINLFHSYVSEHLSNSLVVFDGRDEINAVLSAGTLIYLLRIACKKYTVIFLRWSKQLCVWGTKGLYIVRNISAACYLRTPYIFLVSPCVYIFVFTTRFLILDLFFTTANILIFLKVFFILFESSNVAVSSANILSICFLYSSTDPGNMQQILSLSCFWVERTVRHTESIFCFCLILK